MGWPIRSVRNSRRLVREALGALPWQRVRREARAFRRCYDADPSRTSRNGIGDRNVRGWNERYRAPARWRAWVNETPCWLATGRGCTRVATGDGTAVFRAPVIRAAIAVHHAVAGARGPGPNRCCKEVRCRRRSECPIYCGSSGPIPGSRRMSHPGRRGDSDMFTANSAEDVSGGQPAGPPRRARCHRPAADGQEPTREHAGPLGIYAKPTFDAGAEATARLDLARRRRTPD